MLPPTSKWLKWKQLTLSSVNEDMELWKLPRTVAGNAKLHGYFGKQCGSLTSSPEISFLGICPGEITIHVHIKYYIDVRKSLIHNDPRLETLQMSIICWVDEKHHVPSIPWNTTQQWGMDLDTSTTWCIFKAFCFVSEVRHWRQKSTYMKLLKRQNYNDEKQINICQVPEVEGRAWLPRLTRAHLMMLNLINLKQIHDACGCQWAC